MIQVAEKVWIELSNALDENKSIISCQGSSRSGKTYNILIKLITYILKTPGTRLSIVRKTLPALKGSVLIDFKEIVNRMELWSDKSFNKTELIYKFGNGSWVEFFSTDDEQKIRGRKRNILFVNEANEISYLEWQQLVMRTTMFSVIDYNPSFSEDHWIETVNKDPDCHHFISTYKDNPFLEQKIIDDIEKLRDKNESLWTVYGLGLRAVIEGRIFDSYEIVDEIPEWVRRRWIGMDFGYSCFEGNTLIETIEGPVPISQIKEGTKVLTRKGYRKVKKVFNNGLKEVIEREINTSLGKIKIIATPDHKFNANNKWKKYGELTEKDNLFVLSHLMERNLKDTQTGSIPDITTINGRKENGIILNCSIMQCLKHIMVKFQRIKLYTILMVTLLITHFIIWLLLAFQNTLNFITVFLNLIRNTVKYIVTKLDLGKITGQRDELRLQKDCNQKKGNASTASHYSHQQIPIKDSARTSATIAGNILQRSLILNLNAKVAVRYLRGINTLNQKRADMNAVVSYREVVGVKTTKSNIIRQVFDLEVDDEHEYFANGILVHNCDPTAIIEVAIDGEYLYLDEICYRTRMLTNDIIKVLKTNCDKKKIISESADPRMIDEIYNAGVNIHAVEKYAGSVDAGLTKMKEFKIRITKKSANLKKEFDNYVYAQDKEGKYLNEPVDQYNHGIDGSRYVILTEVIGKNRRKSKWGELSGALP